MLLNERSRTKKFPNTPIPDQTKFINTGSLLNTDIYFKRNIDKQNDCIYNDVLSTKKYLFF